MRLACADFTFPLLAHQHALQLIAMLDFQGVDIGLFEGRSHLWPSREFQHPERAAKALKQRLDDLGLQAADIFLQLAADFAPMALNHPEAGVRQQARERFLQALDFAKACGCQHVTVLPGVQFEAESYEDSFTRCCEELAWRVAQAEAIGIVFAVEAHIGSIVPDPSSAEHLVSSVPGLSLTLDYTHFTRLGIPDKEVEPLLPYASHFHVRGARQGRLQVNFDQNTIDYARIVDGLRSCNYRGWLGVEYVWIDWEQCNESDNVSESIRFRDFLRSLARQA